MNQVVGVDNTFRRKFDREEYLERARERERAVSYRCSFDSDFWFWFHIIKVGKFFILCIIFNRKRIDRNLKVYTISLYMLLFAFTFSFFFWFGFWILATFKNRLSFFVIVLETCLCNITLSNIILLLQLKVLLCIGSPWNIEIMKSTSNPAWARLRYATVDTDVNPL